MHDAYVFIFANNIVYIPTDVKLYAFEDKGQYIVWCSAAIDAAWGVQIALMVFNRTKQIVDIRSSH